MSAVATKPVLGWHFLGADGTMRNGEKPPRAGHYMKHTGNVEMCSSGLHFSRRAIDALDYARGSIVCRVRCRDIVDEMHEKAVCRERKILWRYDATDVLRAFARRCALDVIHLWDAPKVVQEYLETGDEALRVAARATARATAGAAWAAAREAARAARAAARDAAGAAAWDVAGAAAWDVAGAAAWDAARVAAADVRDAQNDLLEKMLEAAR